MPKRDYYEVLGVDRDAVVDPTVKSAYYKLAREFHPDLHPNDPIAEEAFKEVAEAWEVISNSGHRALYDMHGHPQDPPQPPLYLITLTTVMRGYIEDRPGRMWSDYLSTQYLESFMKLTIEGDERCLYVGHARRVLRKLRFVKEPPAGLSMSMEYVYTIAGSRSLHLGKVNLKDVLSDATIQKWEYGA